MGHPSPGLTCHHSDKALGHRVLCIWALTWLIHAPLASTDCLILLPWVLAGHRGVTAVPSVGGAENTRVSKLSCGNGGAGRLRKHLIEKNQASWTTGRPLSCSGEWQDLVWCPKALQISREAQSYYLPEQQRTGDEQAMQSNGTGATTCTRQEEHPGLSWRQPGPPSQCLCGWMCVWVRAWFIKHPGTNQTILSTGCLCRQAWRNMPWSPNFLLCVSR